MKCCWFQQIRSLLCFQHDVIWSGQICPWTPFRGHIASKKLLHIFLFTLSCVATPYSTVIQFEWIHISWYLSTNDSFASVRDTEIQSSWILFSYFQIRSVNKFVCSNFRRFHFQSLQVETSSALHWQNILWHQRHTFFQNEEQFSLNSATLKMFPFNKLKNHYLSCSQYIGGTSLIRMAKKSTSFSFSDAFFFCVAWILQIFSCPLRNRA